jgi:acyl carrier protein
MTVDQHMTIDLLVRDVLVETLGVDAEKVDLDADLEHDLGLDSLDRVDLLTALEEHTGPVSEEELVSIKTVGDAVALVTQRMAST